jgi:hypothetical protein
MSHALTHRSGPAAVLLAGLMVAACGSQVKDKTLPASQSGQQITYTPEGCDYAVTTPDAAVEADYLKKTDAPTVAPSHVHASFAGDASKGFAVNWKADPKGYQTQLFYGTDQSAVAAATEETSAVKVQLGHSVRFTSVTDIPDENNVDQGTLVHEVHVCGLTAATTYYYKVGSKGFFSNVYALTTAPAYGSTTPFRFAVAGDGRNDATIWAHAQKLIKDQGAVLQLFSGDAVAAGALQTQWDAFFETASDGVVASDVMASIPIMMTNGNHDALSANYMAQFALPQPVGGGETPAAKAWYSFNYGNVHFVVLNDTTADGSTVSGIEKTWLVADLAKVDRTKTPWIIATHHQPTYSCSTTHGSNKDVRTAWQPVFDQANVDVVFNGHVHNYERSKPIRGFQTGSVEGVVADATNHGTTYVVAAGVGAELYDVQNSCYHTAYTQKTENFATVDIAGNTLTEKAFDLNTGNSIDTFTITK